MADFIRKYSFSKEVYRKAAERTLEFCRHPDYELSQGLRLPMKGGWEPTNYPFILGHEFSGEIVEMGSKVKEIYPELKVGDWR